MDTCWLQRFDNFQRATTNLERGLQLSSPDEFQSQGIIKAFELAYELAWKTLQDYVRDAGFEVDPGPKNVIRAAVGAGVLAEAEVWLALHEARNRAAHVYDETSAALALVEIRNRFAPAIRELVSRLGQLA